MSDWEVAYSQWKKELDRLVNESGGRVSVYMWQAFKAGWDMRMNYLPLIARQYP